MQPLTRRIQSKSRLHLLKSFIEILTSSSHNLAPAHSAKTTDKWFAGHDISELDSKA